MQIRDILLEYERDRAVQALGKNLLLALIRDTLGLWRVPLDQLQNHLALRKIDVSRYFEEESTDCNNRFGLCWIANCSCVCT